MIAKSGRLYFLANQFRNSDNTMAHYRTSGQEILNQLGAQVDAFVAGVGTGGTLMGVGKVLREKNPDVRLIAVEPTRRQLCQVRKTCGTTRLQESGTVLCQR